MRGSPHILLALTATALTAFADSPSNWTLVVRPFGTAHRESAESFWVGLKNTSGRDRAFCMLGVRYAFDLPDGSLVDLPSVEYPPVGSPHPCADSMGTLVLAGETYFVQVKPTLPAEAVRSAGLRFSVVAEEACLAPKCLEHPGIIVGEEP